LRVASGASSDSLGPDAFSMLTPLTNFYGRVRTGGGPAFIPAFSTTKKPVNPHDTTGGPDPARATPALR